MDLNSFYIKEEKEFLQYKRAVNDVFITEHNLPDQVFKTPFSSFMFEEFDWCMSDEFWKFIRKTADMTKDPFVLMAVLDPEPITYFYREFHYYNWLKIPVELPVADYTTALESGPKESPADAVLYNSFTIVWLSPSRLWGIWGDRECGISIIGFQNEEVKKRLWPELYSWRSLDETVLSWIGLNFKDQTLPQAFLDRFILNFFKD
ncbi:hypothetical protein GKZ89_18300 [Bacillus mangrovi]|uniref:Uncharacterized protein n=1 Tax=Metabacillus mangrovi TaxID=1491830 RepID=A0A7X2V6N3_9BACI|nr:hypothetical protein [Metabacillus mangrovi]MTH55349.1 hypothetical protein [Metabacillus mangrovi]